MKKILLILFIINAQIAIGQNTTTVTEVDKPNIPSYLNELIKSLGDNTNENVTILEKGLKDAKSDYEKYRIARNLGYYYAEAKQQTKNIEMWNTLNKQEIFLPFSTRSRVIPGYLSSYVENEDFKEFIKNNSKLREKALKNSKAEYFVSLPKNYDVTKSYPLIIILHGGFGDFHSTFTNWKSSELSKNYIAVYPQGSQIIGSYTRRFGSKGIEDITQIYNQVIQKYSVNTEQVILAGQSAGGYLSICIAYESIATKGLLLAFPVKPRDFDLKKAISFKEKGINISMVYGAKDKTFFEGQSEFHKLIDEAKIRNNIILYPDLGHAFPSDFSEQMDKALVYLLQ